MTHAFSMLAPAPVLLLLCFTSGCGGSSTPAPSHAEKPAKADPGAAMASREKASRLAKLQADESVERAPEALVRVSLEPLVTGVRPGRKFLLAAHFRIAPGYRISWTNPGEVGKETVVTFTGPAGFQVGRAKFPVPERYTVPGGYVGFGYQNETAVFVEVTAPAALSDAKVHRFDLSASWVACKKECATERTDAFVELATTRGNAAAKDVETSLLPFKQRLPTPLLDVKDAEQKWEPSGSTLVVSIPDSEPREFWPGAQAEPAPKKVAISGNEVRFVFGQKPGVDAKPVRGIVIASAEGKDAFFDLEATSPDAREKAPKRKPAKKVARRRRRG